MKIPPLKIGSGGVVETFLKWVGLSPEKPTTASFDGETLAWGTSRCSVENIRQITITESFLGISNPTVHIHLSPRGTIEFPRIPLEGAKEFKNAIDESLRLIELERAKAPLIDSIEKCRLAWKDVWSAGYLSQYGLNAWLRKHGELAFLRHKDEKFIRENIESPTAMVNCREFFRDPKGTKKWWNDYWIGQELERQDGFFKNLSEHPPTKDQRIALLTHDNRVLAVAGAGTGKTTTAVGKVAYLLHTGYCKPEEILLMTFAKKAAEELEERIATVCGDGIEVRTFHSLGLEIVHKATNIKPSIFDDESGKRLQRMMEDILEEMEKSPLHRPALVSLLTYHFYSPFSRHSFKSEREYLQRLSQVKPKTLQTLKKDKAVKSNQERLIADWLYMNGIAYEYENPYEVETATFDFRQYRPDFYLPDHGIYIEHWGVDKNGKTAPGIDQQRYHEGMTWKRNIHKEHNTSLVETYSWQEWDGSLFNSLEEQLRKLGVVRAPIPPEALRSNPEYSARFKGITGLLKTFLVLFKSSTLTLDDIQKKAVARPQDGRRCKVFLDVFTHIFSHYEEKKKQELDFGDMIRLAVGHVKAGRYKSPFKVVIVDEFQDIAQGRAELMEALFQQVPDTRLFCVGDDWQSIYRFTGSNVQLMTKFTKTSQDAIQVNLSKTFRFNDRILGAASHFITRNKTQLVKKLEPFYTAPTPAIHITSADEDPTDVMDDVLRKISANPKVKTVYILARYNFILQKVDLEGLQGRFPSLEITTWSAHSSKGKEADAVVILGMTSGEKYSFPTEITDDPILDLLLAEPEEHENAEERRLFYVAMTRARHEVWIPCPMSSPSVFIKELLDDPAYLKNGWIVCDSPTLLNTPRCPKCDGMMAPRKPKAGGKMFLGCTNYPWCDGIRSMCPRCSSGSPTLNKKLGRYECSCGWNAPPCPNCSTGWLVPRAGKNGGFMGCVEYGQTRCKGSSSGKN